MCGFQLSQTTRGFPSHSQMFKSIQGSCLVCIAINVRRKHRRSFSLLHRGNLRRICSGAASSSTILQIRTEIKRFCCPSSLASFWAASSEIRLCFLYDPEGIMEKACNEHSGPCTRPLRPLLGSVDKEKVRKRASSLFAYFICCLGLSHSAGMSLVVH